MKHESDDIVDVIRAIASGSSVDWDSVTATPADASIASVLNELKIISRIAEVHGSSRADAVASDEESDEQLQSWGPLTILERVGRGSYGDVYRAWDSRLDRDVALKLLRREVVMTGDRSPVIEEGRLLARVRHPNVPTVYGAECIAGRIGIWTEFIDGEALQTRVAEQGPMPPAEVATIGVDVCRALAAVHKAGLLHRDVKAQNVMREAGGRIVLMDFGTTRLAANTGGHGLAGTPLYLAPEVLSRAEATPASDIYSVGVLLYYLLTGHYPAEGLTLDDVRSAHARGTPSEHVRTLRRHVPARLGNAIARALAHDPSNRFESAEAMANALVVRAPSSAFPRLWLAAGAASVAAVAVFGALTINRGESSSGAQGSAQPVGVFANSSAVNIRRLDLPGDVLYGQLSPDGRYLPYFEYADARLMLLEVATGKIRNLASDPGRKDVQIESAVVSPDNSEVAYSWESGECGCIELRSVGTQGTGNPPRVLLRDESLAGIVNESLVGIAPVDWMPDRTGLLVSRSRNNLTHEIALVSTQDGSVHVLKAGLEHGVSMHLSPDGRYVAYDYPVAADNDARDIFVLAADGSGEVPLVQGRSQDASPMWTPDGRGVVFVSDRSGALGLWVAPIVNGQPNGIPQVLQKDMGRIGPISLARNGTLFYSLQNMAVDVYTARFGQDGTILANSTAQAAGSSFGSNMDPDWSPDGRSLAYVSRRRLMGPRATALVVRSLDTGEEHELWPDLAQFFARPRWSPDGHSFLVGGTNRQGVRGPWLLDARTGAIRAKLPHPGAEWAPGGRAVFDIDFGQKGVQRTDVSSGRTREIYHDPSGFIGGFAVSPDGQSLAIAVDERGAQPGVRKLEVVSTSGGPAREIMSFTEPDLFVLQQWTRDGASILFTRARYEKPRFIKGDWELWSVPAAGGAPRSLRLSGPRLRGVRISPGGEHIAFRTGDPGWDYWLMDNFVPRAGAGQR